jgi:AraC-like DNA-binding protein
MLGSQIIDINPRIAGCDLRVPEVRVFGYCKFRKAVRTNDDWGSHSGPEIVFLIEGEACWETDDEQLVQAVGGQAIVFPRGNRHRIVNAVYPPSESVWIIMKDPAETSAPSLLTPEAHRDFCALLDAGGHLWDAGPACLAQVLDLGRLLVDPAIFSGGGLIISEFRAKLHNVLLEFWKTCDRHALNGRASGVVQAAKSFLQENLVQEISISELAERLGCSRGHLHAAFRREMGMSPNDYLQRLRIKRCCDKLRTSTDSITEVAFGNGFDSAQYFARVFRKYLGFSPTEFRARAQSARGH